MMAFTRYVPVLLALALPAIPLRAQETAEPVAAPAKAEATSTQETLRAYLLLQEQLHATQLAIERNRKEADAAAAENAKILTGRLQGIEQALSEQRTQELEAMRSSNKVMLFIAGLFAALGFLAMLFMAYFQWRTINRLAEISATLPVAHAFGAALPSAALGSSDGHTISVGPAEQSNQRLLGALEQLEKRIHQLEHIPAAPLQEPALASPAPAGPSESSNGDGTADVDPGADAERIPMLLGRGQSLLNLDQPEEALACFETVLSIEAEHPEALVKKGAALERLRRVDDAIACYDRAIASDKSFTVAYLYKAGLYNRMERFDEALACYEQALRTHELRRG